MIETWQLGTCAIIGDSMLNRIERRKISKKRPVKVRPLACARIQNMCHL